MDDIIIVLALESGISFLEFSKSVFKDLNGFTYKLHVFHEMQCCLVAIQWFHVKQHSNIQCTKLQRAKVLCLLHDMRFQFPDYIHMKMSTCCTINYMTGSFFVIYRRSGIKDGWGICFKIGSHTRTAIIPKLPPPES